MQITACLIVRNEEAMLEIALASLAGVDEIVIVDTGSKDKTLEIARRYTDKVFEFYECNEPQTADGLFMNFSQPRNFAALQASNDWILVIDADETLEAGAVEKFREAIKDTQCMAVSCTVHVMEKETGTQVRLYNRKFVKWFDAAHNWLGVHTDSGVKMLGFIPQAIIETDISILSGFSPNHNNDPDRTLRILSTMLKADPKHVRALFYIAREYLNRNNSLIAAYYLQKYCKFVTDKTNELAEALYTLGCIEGDLGDFNEAREYFFKSAAVLPTLKANYERLSEFHCEPLSLIFKKFSSVVDNQGAMVVKH